MTADEVIRTRLVIEKCELCASDWEFEATNCRVMARQYSVGAMEFPVCWPRELSLLPCSGFG